MSIAAEKKRAEVESDDVWVMFSDAMEQFIDGEASLNDTERHFRNFKLAHNTERGLRHESDE